MTTEGSSASAWGDLERETELIASAMRLVAAGGATRAIVAGLRLTDAALAIAARDAAELGVIVEAIARPDHRGLDALVRRRPLVLVA
jgi:hypothetical protein